MSERNAERVERIGLIGVGRMGSRMGARLLGAGWDLVVHDVDQASVESFAARGAAVADSPREVADQADVVLLSLPRPEHVRAVVTGDAGVASGSRAHTCIDLSTTGPEVAKELSEALAAVDMQMLDAPVSGGPVGAEAGTLCVMIGGPREAFDRCAAIFAPLGTSIVWLGEQSGYGQRMKVINNMISASCLAATSEGMVLGTKAGLDPGAMIQVLNSSTGRNAHSEQKFPNNILTRKFDFGFQLGLMLKDLRLCMAMAEELGVTMWVSSEVRQLVALAVSNAGDDQDVTALIKQVEAWAGVEVAAKDAVGALEDG